MEFAIQLNVDVFITSTIEKASFQNEVLCIFYIKILILNLLWSEDE
jgi:hypothetical protein